MAITISNEVKEIINSPDTLKVLATVSREGVPHVVFKGSIKVNEEGLIEYLEIIESSQTNKNMVNSIWFNKTVAINVFQNKRSFQIKGKVKQSIIAGRKFEERYIQIKEKKNVDLSAIYLIEPEEIQEESFEKRRLEELEKHPILQHLDRLTK